MKKVVALLLLFMGVVAEAKTMSLEEAKAFLTDEKKAVHEPGMPPRRTAQDLAFHRFVADDWKRALTLLENDAPDLRRQNLIVVVAEVLPAQDYVLFLNGVCDLIESGKLKMPSWCFGIGSFIKQGFLAYNYDQPEVAALINRIEALYKIHEPGNWEDYFLEVKSGERKKYDVQMLTSYGDPLPETYKSHPEEAYRRLVKEHNEILAEVAKREREQIKFEQKKIVRMVDEDGSVRIMEVDIPPEDEPVDDKPTPWKFPLFIGILILGSGVAAWLYLKKEKL